MAFHPPKPVPPGLWRRTPPAVFPSILGLFGLGLAWRRGSLLLDWPSVIGEIVLGAVTGLFAFAMLAYVVKLARRPAVLAEDLTILPGRAGLAAQCLSVYLAAAALWPYVPGVARAVLYAGLLWHGVVVVVMIARFVRGPKEQRRVTPVWHLSFVGFIVAALAAQPMRLAELAEVIFVTTFFLALVIWGASLEQFRREGVPAPLRPLLAIHLSPAALFGLVALGFDLKSLAMGFAGFSAAILILLVIRVRWLTASGFTPFWGAFTFPLAATASLWLALGGIWAVPGVIALAATSAIVPLIGWRVLRLWARGQLATITNAAVA
ncbi:tellurium resistance protein [Defluviimonas sp. WL0075]|uniref:Tellurium resistance protein n=1 Tax=Albidovulum sediminicola TaxID=2984331 RepID=A0ABT2YZJ1_9RHOB|nr:tellurium resistance protein [Defluviimonas sp. WL0075]MCV2864308.1 tellurium resistance protein [Defluviimonas sp. WL0075]